MVTLTTADVLDRAADRVTGHWIQRGLMDYNGDLGECGVCVLGAINWVATGHPMMLGGVATTLVTRIEASDLVHDAKNVLRVAAAALDLGDWNDAEDRTEVEVVAALRKAADLARSRA